ncbi:MAG: glycerol-3-phosphate acyltransferase, partial [Pseudomonadota bacterium]
AGLATCATWLVIAGLARYSSMAAMFSALMAPVWLLFTGYGIGIAMGALLGILIYWRHGDNIQRLRAGTETKIGQKG